MFPAFGLEVAVASPGDAEIYSEAVEDATLAFNRVHARSEGVLLVPRRWRHDASPLAGVPQESINRDVIDPADCLVALFWSSIGASGTAGDGSSGTLGEIERAIEQGKRVLIFCSQEPRPPAENNPEQLAALNTFRAEWRHRALFRDFSDRDDLVRMLGEEFIKYAREVSKAPGQSSQSSQPTLPGELERLRSELAGNVATIQNHWKSLMASDVPDVNEMKALGEILAEELNSAHGQAVRLLGSADAALPQDLGLLAQSAFAAAQTRLTMDGGRSYGRLTSGVERVFEQVSYMLAAPWTAYVAISMPVDEQSESDDG